MRFLRCRLTGKHIGAKPVVPAPGLIAARRLGITREKILLETSRRAVEAKLCWQSLASGAAGPAGRTRKCWLAAGPAGARLLLLLKVLQQEMEPSIDPSVLHSSATAAQSLAQSSGG